MRINNAKHNLTIIIIIIYLASHFSDQRPSAPVDNRSYVLASHERLPVHVDLATAETGVSSTKAVKGRTGGAVED